MGLQEMLCPKQCMWWAQPVPGVSLELIAPTNTLACVKMTLQLPIFQLPTQMGGALAARYPLGTLEAWRICNTTFVMRTGNTQRATRQHKTSLITELEEQTSSRSLDLISPKIMGNSPALPEQYTLLSIINIKRVDNHPSQEIILPSQVYNSNSTTKRIFRKILGRLLHLKLGGSSHFLHTVRVFHFKHIL